MHETVGALMVFPSPALARKYARRFVGRIASADNPTGRRASVERRGPFIMFVPLAAPVGERIRIHEALERLQ